MPIVTMIVKAKHGAMVYVNGSPVPDDQYIEVPVSPSVVNAVIHGDLEEMESNAPAGPVTRKGSRRDSTDSPSSS